MGAEVEPMGAKDVPDATEDDSDDAVRYLFGPLCSLTNYIYRTNGPMRKNFILA
jgi:hypothetical protein